MPTPTTPTNPAAASLSATSIRVTWDDVGDEDAYQVERSADGVSGWAEVSGELAAGTTQYDDTGLAGSTEYFYRVISLLLVHTIRVSTRALKSTTTSRRRQQSCPPQPGVGIGSAVRVRYVGLRV